jgi:hypothetical protein
VWRLASRVATTPEELLRKTVRTRPQSIYNSNLNAYPSLATKAAELLARQVPQPKEVGRKALVSVSTKGGVIDVPCTVVRKFRIRSIASA